MPGKTVLIVDDDPIFRDGLTEVLENAGYRALSAADGREAVALLENNQAVIDLMIVDLCLPDVNGFDIIVAVARRKTPIKIIAASGVFDETYLEIAKSMGANEGVRKPESETAGSAEYWLMTVRRLLGESGSEAAQNPLQKIVLLADDERSVRSYAKTVLQHDGYQVLEAADGLDALALFRKLGGAVDILVTDINMPRMSGLELAKSIRSGCPHMPVVYISGRPQEQLHDPKARIILVPKPFSQKELLKAVRDLLSQSAGASSSGKQNG